ncbi:Xylose isomerase domain-containing protein TIM barrel [Sphingobium chlorophenolicum L-1]|uniref:Xylose isomerase domain-containing protein TIM barrel n=1 Tax=Sphingobium chlorophenolicum L-1 TaxID=690566 RepID=F6F3C0_SPHCR|nr:sugar phosphate isomerase/epimerase [Sphingobium chlorophenolicum]AEG50932.1 Xylose isomerase domain-containing protein TIM barrel [Sphingobium chlorophenolicum L-1]
MTAKMNRRTLISALTVGGLVAATGANAKAKPSRPFFERINQPIGLQLYALGDAPAQDLEGTFHKVAAIGYREIEFSSLYGHDAKFVRAAADRAGLSLTCFHLQSAGNGGTGPLTLDSDPQHIADTMGILGIKKTVMPIFLFPQGFNPGPGNEAFLKAMFQALPAAGQGIWKRTAALLNDRAAKLQPHGITLGYHNHGFEFAPIGGTNGWQILTQETDPALVDFELDIGWLGSAGVDPLPFLRRYGKRIKQLHVKDILPPQSDDPALAMSPTQVGDGILDWARILPASVELGVQHFYVEQEPPFAIPRIEAITRSYNYLARLCA